MIRSRGPVAFWLLSVAARLSQPGRFGERGTERAVRRHVGRAAGAHGAQLVGRCTDRSGGLLTASRTAREGGRRNGAGSG